MPELPEVETTLRGIAPWLLGRTIHGIVVREPRLRWPVPAAVQQACGRRVERLERRAKYLLIGVGGGGLLVHLGMSGSLRVVTDDAAPRKHDHFDLRVPGAAIRFNDPRRFGCLLWWEDPPESHPLLVALGPEPLGEAFSGAWLYRRSRGRRVAVKNFIMDAKVVVGVGNIYASEALHLAGIHPARAAGRISARRYEVLAGTVRAVLSRAVRHGGTTLRDYVNSSGQPGYFARELRVYGHAGEPCKACGGLIRQRVIGQRSTFYCPACQR